MTPEQRAAAERLIAEHPTLFMNDLPDWCDDAFHLLRELAAEPVQKPVAYIDQRQLAAGYVTLLCITRPEYRSYADVAEGIHYTPVYLHPPQQPMRCPEDGGECGAGGYCRPEPQQRRPLTDEEALAIIKSTPQEDVTQEGWIRRQRLSWVRAIERAHGITGEQE